MKKLLLFFSIISFTAGAQIDSALGAQLQALLNTKITQGNKGVAARLIMPNGQSWSGTAGVNHQNVPITDSTVFRGASTTKFNVALLMLLLQQDGLIDLDDTWHQYVSLNVAFDTSITIRQLLNHTSGIADYLETQATPTNVTSNYNYSYTPQYILENVVKPTPDFAAGTSFNYSTSNYVLAALVAEAVTGNPVQTELHNRLWNPLGMKHTYFGVCETFTETTAGAWCNFGNGLMNYSNQPSTSMLSYGYGGANIITCATDLARLLHALFNNQVLSAQSMSEMMAFVPASYTSWTKGYGLGIHHLTQAGDTVLGHDGYYTNLSDMFHSKKYGFTLVTMTNTETTWFGIINPMYTLVANYFKTLGVAQLANDVEWSVYPNPNNGQCLVKSPKVLDEIVVTDVLGRVVYKANPNNNSVNLQLPNTGLHFVTVKLGPQTATKKMLVQQ